MGFIRIWIYEKSSTPDTQKMTFCFVKFLNRFDQMNSKFKNRLTSKVEGFALATMLTMLTSLTISAQDVSYYEQRHYTLMGLGDSITEGGPNFTSYLYPLWEKLFAAGFSVEFIGPRNAATSIGGIAHAGFSGRTAEFLDSSIDSIYSAYPADIVLLHAGHNHFQEEQPVAGIINAQESIVQQIKAINPNAIIVLSKVIESGKLPKYAYIPELNDALERLYEKLDAQYEGVYLVDQSAEFEWPSDAIKDNVHPNPSGAQKMANVWFEELQTILEEPPITFSPAMYTYKSTSTEELKLHVFSPQNGLKNRERSCVVFFFGGGWKVGTPLQFYREASYLASRGIVAISADYRTEFENGSTAFESVSDAKSAIRWIRAHAQELGIDPNRIAAAGASAGGHLAAATATLGGLDEVDEDLTISSRPNLNILYYPVIDNGPKGYRAGDLKSNYKDISPIHNLRVAVPPTLILVGTEDKSLPVATAEKYQQLLKELGVACELRLYPGAGHPIFYYRKGYSPYYDQMMADTEEFLIKHDFLEP